MSGTPPSYQLCTCGHANGIHGGVEGLGGCLNWDVQETAYCPCMAFVMPEPETRTDLCEQCKHELTDHVWDGCTVPVHNATLKTVNYTCTCTGFVLPGKTG